MRRSSLMVATVVLASTAWAKPVEVAVEGLGIDSASGTPVVKLIEKAKGHDAPAARELPIWIGPFEAQAIALEMEGVAAPRPLTHDLMKQLVERLGGKLLRVVVGEVRENTYYATLHLAAPGGKRMTVDARPSDGIALALRLHAPVLVEEELFARAASVGPAPAAAHLWGLTLQDLTPELAALIDVREGRGVLVSDVAAAAPAREVLRGDVITALDDDRVESVDELTKRADGRTNSPVRLSVRRGDRKLELTFTP